MVIVKIKLTATSSHLPHSAGERMVIALCRRYAQSMPAGGRETLTRGQEMK